MVWFWATVFKSNDVSAEYPISYTAIERGHEGGSSLVIWTQAFCGRCLQCCEQNLAWTRHIRSAESSRTCIFDDSTVFTFAIFCVALMIACFHRNPVKGGFVTPGPGKARISFGKSLVLDVCILFHFCQVLMIFNMDWPEEAFLQVFDIPCIPRCASMCSSLSSYGDIFFRCGISKGLRLRVLVSTKLHSNSGEPLFLELRENFPRFFSLRCSLHPYALFVDWVSQYRSLSLCRLSPTISHSPPL